MAEPYEFLSEVQIDENRMFRAAVIRRPQNYGGDLVFETRQFYRRGGQGDWQFSKNGLSLSLTRSGVVGTPDGDVEVLEAELVLDAMCQFLSMLQGGSEDA